MNLEQACIALWDKSGVAVSVEPIEYDYSDIYVEEQALVEEASEKRRREFASGRVAARRVLQKLGVTDFPLLASSERVPIWPDGICGSISHTKDCCVAVAASKAFYRSIGVDIELADRLKEKLWGSIGTRNEVLFLESNPELGTVLFSIKEAFYKCQYPLTGEWIGFKDAEVCIQPESRTWELKLLQKGTIFQGRYLCVGNYVIAGIGI